MPDCNTCPRTACDHQESFLTGSLSPHGQTFLNLTGWDMVFPISLAWERHAFLPDDYFTLFPSPLKILPTNSYLGLQSRIGTVRAHLTLPSPPSWEGHTKSLSSSGSPSVIEAPTQFQAVPWHTTWHTPTRPPHTPHHTPPPLPPPQHTGIS